MSTHDLAYFNKRAEAERQLAERAATPEAARAHRELAELHRNRASQSGSASV